MNNFLRLLWAFLKRDYLRWGIRSLLLQSGKWMALVLLWSFVSPSIHRVGGISNDYFTYSIIGFAFAQFLWNGLHVASNQVKQLCSPEQLQLTWQSPFSLSVLLVCSSAWSFLVATINSGVILAFGAYGLGAHLSGRQILCILGIAVPTAFAMACLGIGVGVAMVIFGGRWGSIRMLLSRFIFLTNGIFIPLAALPDWLRVLAYAFPLTHALILARSVVFPAPAGEVVRASAALGVMTLALFAAAWGGLRVLQFRIHRAGRELREDKKEPLLAGEAAEEAQ